MVFTTFTNGTVADATEVNTNFGSIFTILGKDETGGSTQNTSYTKIGEVSIGASAVNYDILIFVNIKGISRYVTIGSTRPIYFDLRIGESGSETSKRVFDTTDMVAIGSQETDPSPFIGQITYGYSPTASELTNGFNIQIYGKCTATVDFEKVIVNSIYVFGV